MKITKVRTAVIDGNFPWVLVRVETDAPVTGLGEAYWGTGVAELVHRAGELLLGEDPTNIGKLVFLMERCLSGEGAQAGRQYTVELEHRPLVEDHGVQVVRLQPGLVQAPFDGQEREGRVVLAPRQAFFLHRADRHAVHQQGGGGVVIVR